MGGIAHPICVLIKDGKERIMKINGPFRTLGVKFPPGPLDWILCFLTIENLSI